VTSITVLLKRKKNVVLIITANYEGLLLAFHSPPKQRFTTVMCR